MECCYYYYGTTVTPPMWRPFRGSEGTRSLVLPDFEKIATWRW